VSRREEDLQGDHVDICGGRIRRADGVVFVQVDRSRRGSRRLCHCNDRIPVDFRITETSQSAVRGCSCTRGETDFSFRHVRSEQRRESRGDSHELEWGAADVCGEEEDRE
jgi:hypothetical protein